MTTQLEREAEEYAIKVNGSHPNDEEDRRQCAFNFIDGWRACREAMLAVASARMSYKGLDCEMIESFGEEASGDE